MNPRSARFLKLKGAIRENMRLLAGNREVLTVFQGIRGGDFLDSMEVAGKKKGDEDFIFLISDSRTVCRRSTDYDTVSKHRSEVCEL